MDQLFAKKNRRPGKRLFHERDGSMKKQFIGTSLPEKGGGVKTGNEMGLVLMGDGRFPR